MASDNLTSMQEIATSTREVEDRLRRGCADLTALCRGNIGATMASSQAAICGVQEITATLLAFLQSRAKDSVAAGQRLAACDSPEALIEVQLEYAKAMLQAHTDEFA
ncbi:MAG: phasin family protein, partial [Geminicoccaceae bacterium]